MRADSINIPKRIHNAVSSGASEHEILRTNHLNKRIYFKTSRIFLYIIS